MRHSKYFLWVIFLVLADQLSKWLAYENLGLGAYQITDFLSLTFVQNFGAAFSFLADGGGWQRYFLSAISITASVAIIIWMFQIHPRHRLKLSALSLILAGAIGNMIDRIFSGFVIDFIDFHYAGWGFPVFNLADSLIFIGVVLLLISERK
ncbi:MAG: signal peptidase II [Betaproteobacteria bacterium]|nr:signal peptidase II [Betaproteobacteria bacterium]MBE8189511.1 signal peptidase II [Candidatus Thioglobus sp.]